MKQMGLKSVIRRRGYNSFEQLEEDIKGYIKFYNTERMTLKMGLRISA